MTVSFKPLRTENGFQSPGFTVDASGNVEIDGTLTVNSPIEVTDEINAIQLLVENVPLTENNGTGLSTSILTSHLTTLGTLDNLNVSGNVELTDNTSFLVLSIVNGEIAVTSKTVGSIDNVDIGLVTPGLANFKDVNIGTALVPAILDVTGSIDLTGTLTVSVSANIPIIVSTSVDATTLTTTTINADIGNIDAVNATSVNADTLTSDTLQADDITINNQPTQLFHATRKDYVDNRISAFAIAFGL